MLDGLKRFFTGAAPPKAPVPSAPTPAPELIVHRTVPPQGYVITGAQSEAEAADRYAATKALDPFPDVPPALLNSAHIEDYMIATAMVFPYEPKRRKSASYAMRVGNRMAFFDPSRPQQTPYRDLKDFASFVLPPNSLVYVQTKELFQLPNYMAVRFNLHIELVHKGLLLGTGPLVDPGFSGRLLIPLHNMTANSYVLAEDDELIWVEFTKTSSHPHWLPPKAARSMPGKPHAKYADFPGPKTNQRIEDYFRRARRPHESRPGADDYPFPANAIPGRVEEARDLAQTAAQNAEGARLDAEKSAASARRFSNIGLLSVAGAAIGIVLPLFGLLYSSWTMMQTNVQMADGSNGQIRRLSQQLSEVRTSLALHEIGQARLITIEYCIELRSPAPSRSLPILARRLLLARQAADATARAAGRGPPFTSLAPPSEGTCPR